MTFTTREERDEATATLEDNHINEDRANFLNYDNARFVYSTIFDKTNGASPGYAQRLSGGEDEKIGLAKSFSVMPGDTIRAEVFAKYYDVPVDTTTLAQMLRTLLWYVLNPASSGGHVVDKIGYGTGASSGIPWTGDMGEQDDATAPKAFLNYIWINRDYDTASIRVKYVPITTAARETGTDSPHEPLSLEDIVTEAGYVYVFLSNDGDEVREVYFDDFSVEHVKSPVVSSQSYYPFGLTFNSYSRENSLQNQYQFNSKELQDELSLGWLDYGARMYMYDIGRWGVLDPLAEIMRRHSPYNYAFNNPLRFIDPDGMAPENWWGAGADAMAKTVDESDGAASVFGTGNEVRSEPTWASKPGFGVHQKANANGVRRLTARNRDRGWQRRRIELLDAATVQADGAIYQTAEFSYRHGMRDGSTGQTVEEARVLADQFVRYQFH
jgi:RHS repeat-associated protein